MGPPEGGPIASHSATPAGRKTHPEREWFTPAEYWDDIRPASTNEGAVGGEWSDEVTCLVNMTDRGSRTSRSRKGDSVTMYRDIQDSRRETAPVRSAGQRPSRVPPPTAPRQQPRCDPPRIERVVERRPPVRERPRGAAEWIDPDRTPRAPDLRKVESERRVARSVAISSGSEDGEDSDWNRVAYSRRSVLSESDEGARAESKRACEAASAGEQTLRAVKLLKDWGLKFSGEEREDPEEFLERIEECRKGAAVGDEGLLNALPCVLTKVAARWFRTMRLEPPSWAGFRKAFRHQFVTEYDREDLLDDLRRRTQAKGEIIATYLANLYYIVSRFKQPPSERHLVETAY